MATKGRLNRRNQSWVWCEDFEIDEAAKARRRWERKERTRERLWSARCILERIPQRRLDLILDPREQLVLKGRSGLLGNGPCTFAQIAGMVGVTDERVRQIQNAALIKLVGKTRR